MKHNTVFPNDHLDNPKFHEKINKDVSSVNVPEPRTTNSIYITLAKGHVWDEKKIDHAITKLVCNIADTALPPREAAGETITIIREMVMKSMNSSSPTDSA